MVLVTTGKRKRVIDVWVDETVEAGKPSDPIYVHGYARKTVIIYAGAAGTLSIEAAGPGGTWIEIESVSVSKSLAHSINHAVSAVRFVYDTTTTLTLRVVLEDG